MKTIPLALALVAFCPLAEAGTFLVTTTADAGPGSLRQAILSANAAAETNTINFSAAGAITLAAPLPTINGAMTINGPGTNSLTVNGNNAVQILTVSTQAIVTISGLTIANGKATGSVRPWTLRCHPDYNLVIPRPPWLGPLWPLPGFGGL